MLRIVLHYSGRADAFTRCPSSPRNPLTSTIPTGRPSLLPNSISASCQAQQRKARALLGQQINRILLGHVCGCATRQQADEVQRKFLLHRVEVIQKSLPIDLLNVHGVKPFVVIIT